MANWRVLSMENKVSGSSNELVVIATVEKTEGPGYARKVFVETLDDIVGPSPLTPYGDLTEGEVIALITSSLGPTVTTDSENYVDSQALLKSASIVDIPANAGLPWSAAGSYDPVS